MLCNRSNKAGYKNFGTTAILTMDAMSYFIGISQSPDLHTVKDIY